MAVLGFMWLSLQFLGGIAAFVVAVHVVRRAPTVGFLSIGAFVVVASDFPVLSPLSGVAGLSVFPEDVLTGILLAEAIPRVRRVNAALGGRGGWWLLVTAFAVLSLARGAMAFDLGTALNGARTTVYLLVATFWVLSQVDDDGLKRRLDLFVRVLGWALVGIALLHISTRGFGSADTQIQQSGLLVTDRPLVSGQAAVIAMAGVYQLVHKRRMVSATMFLLIATVAQHRSVWVATAAGLVILVLAGRPVARRRIIVLATAVPATALFAAVLGLLGDLPQRLAHSLSSTGTLEGRTFAWTTLVTEQNAMGFYFVLFGQPFGTSWDRINSDGRIESFAPHNWYVQLYLRLGLIAAVLTIGLLMAALRRATRAGDVAAVWLGMLIVFAMPYHLPWYLAPMLAVGLAAGSRLALDGEHQRSRQFFSQRPASSALV